MSKKVVVITGGAGGIGLACAEYLKDYDIILTDYSDEVLVRAQTQLQSLGIEAKTLACDITSKTDIDKLRDFCSKQGELAGVVHTAGVSGSLQDTRKVYNIDLLGTKYVLDSFYEVAKPNFAVVLFASMVGHTVPANDSYDAALLNPEQDDSFAIVDESAQHNSDLMYNFAKRGVLLLTQANAPRFGQKGARVVSISPGIIMTPMAKKAAEEHPEQMQQMLQITPVGRNGEPEDIAKAVKFLISDEASFITGTDLLVDGGLVNQLLKNSQTE